MMRVQKSATAEQYYFNWAVDGVTGNSGTISTTDTSGKFKIERTGTTATGYYWNGSSWVAAGQKTGIWTDDVNRISMSPRSQSGATNDLTLNYDNFTVVNGEPVADAKGSNPGKIYGATQVAAQAGFGNALSFNGTSNYVPIGNESNFDFERTDAFTAGAWLKTSASSGSQVLISKMANSSPCTGYELYINASGAIGAYLVNDYSANNYISEVTMPSGYNDDDWHYVFMTYDGSSTAAGFKIYVDGSEKITNTYMDTLTGSILNDVSLMWATRNNEGRYLNGYLDDVAIWSRALDSYEIASLSSLGTENFENLLYGINNASALDLDYTTEQLSILAAIYAQQDTDGVAIGGILWKYLGEEDPIWDDHSVGDVFEVDGVRYVMLGSGLGGEPLGGGDGVPEPATVVSLLSAIFMLASRRVIKRIWL
jgi:hypothetical protein